MTNVFNGCFKSIRKFWKSRTKWTNVRFLCCTSAMFRQFSEAHFVNIALDPSAHNHINILICTFLWKQRAKSSNTMLMIYEVISMIGKLFSDLLQCKTFLSLLNFLLLSILLPIIRRYSYKLILLHHKFFQFWSKTYDCMTSKKHSKKCSKDG